MKTKQTLVSYGDLFVIEGQCAYISNIVWKEKQQVYAYTITVIYRINLFDTVIKAGT
jgi:hypothetical protein